MDLAAPEGQAHVVEGLHLPEAAAQALELQFAHPGAPYWATFAAVMSCVGT